MMSIGVGVGVTANLIGTNSSSSGIVIRSPSEGVKSTYLEGEGVFCISDNCVSPLE